MQSKWQDLITQPAGLAQPTGITHLLIDQGRWPEAMTALYQTLESPEFTILFIGTPHELLLPHSPLLLSLPGDLGRYQPLLSEVMAKRAGIGLRSGASLASLSDHFRQFLTVIAGQGLAYLRFYDPAVWLGCWLAGKGGALCAPLSHWWLPDWTAPGRWREQVLAAAPPVSPAPAVVAEASLQLTPELSQQCRFGQLLYLLPAHQIVTSLWLAACLQPVIASGLTESWEWQPWYQLLAAYPERLSRLPPRLTPHFMAQPNAFAQLKDLLTSPVHDVIEVVQ